MIKGPSEEDTLINPAPIAIIRALALIVPLRPHLSMITLANMLPSSPPTVYTEVRTEKVASVIGMHVGRP